MNATLNWPYVVAVTHAIDAGMFIHLIERAEHYAEPLH